MYDFKKLSRFSHGGPEYDAKYPDGIPTAIDITLKSGKVPDVRR